MASTNKEIISLCLIAFSFYSFASLLYLFPFLSITKRNFFENPPASIFKVFGLVAYLTHVLAVPLPGNITKIQIVLSYMNFFCRNVLHIFGWLHNDFKLHFQYVDLVLCRIQRHWSSGQSGEYYGSDQTPYWTNYNKNLKSTKWQPIRVLIIVFRSYYENIF